VKRLLVSIALTLPTAWSTARADAVGCVECAHIAALTDTLPGTFSEVVRGTFHEDITGRDRTGCMCQRRC